MRCSNIKRPFLRGLFSLGLCLFLSACAENLSSDSSLHSKYTTVQGKAQGSTFTIIYSDTVDLSNGIDSLLNSIDASLSTYRNDSRISILNSSSSVAADRLLLEMYSESLKYFDLSKGAFNPAIGRLLRFWGFDASKISAPHSIDLEVIENLKRNQDLRGFSFLSGDSIEIGLTKAMSSEEQVLMIKRDTATLLSFNAIAQGYSVDLLAEYLASYGIKNYMIELGGEMRVLGLNQSRQPWRLGVDKPTEEVSSDRSLKAIISLSEGALATSGSYRKFYELDGVKYSHTIDPITGFPVTHSLLSVTVIAPTATEADAMATVFMVLGEEKSIELLKSLPHLKAYLIWADKDGKYIEYSTEGLNLTLL